MHENASFDDDVRQLAGELSQIAQDHDDSHVTMKNIETKIRVFKKSKKVGSSEADPSVESEAAQ
jgi:hypothetical protein